MFKINAETIRVVTKSDLPIEICHQPLLPTMMALTTSTMHSTHSQVDTALTPCTQFKVSHEETNNNAANDELLMKIDWSNSESSQTSNTVKGKVCAM